jgi:predicted RNase H-like nuclease (RuvC/YqgF family)
MHAHLQDNISSLTSQFQNFLVVRQVCVRVYCIVQSEVKRLQDENNTLTKELEIEKEKLHTLEAALEQLRKQGYYQQFKFICRSH